LTVYLVMGLNALVDGLLLLATGQLTGTRLKTGRGLAAALLGGFYGGLCLAPEFSCLGGGVWRALLLGLLGLIAFGWHRTGRKQALVFLVLGLTMEGLVLCLRTGGLPMLLTAVGLWLLYQGIVADGGMYFPLELQYGEKTLRLTALRDTGNGLKDPVTGEQVVVISAGAAETMTGLTRSQLRDPLGTLTSSPLPGLRLIPYHGIGGTGLLLAMRFPEGKLAGRRIRPLVAFAPEGLEEGFQALTGGHI